MCANPNRPDVRLSNFDAGTQQIVADIGALFARTNLGQVSLCHSSGECAGAFQQVGVDLATGQPLEAQAVFRVE